MIKLFVLCLLILSQILQTESAKRSLSSKNLTTSPTAVTITHNDAITHDVTKSDDVRSKGDTNEPKPDKGESKDAVIHPQKEVEKLNNTTVSKHDEVTTKVVVEEDNKHTTIKNGLRSDPERIDNDKMGLDDDNAERDEKINTSVRREKGGGDDNFVTVKPKLRTIFPYPLATMDPQNNNRTAELIKLINKIDKHIVSLVVHPGVKKEDVKVLRSIKRVPEAPRAQNKVSRSSEGGSSLIFLLQPFLKTIKTKKVYDKLWNRLKNKKKSQTRYEEAPRKHPEGTEESLPRVYLLRPSSKVHERGLVISNPEVVEDYIFRRNNGLSKKQTKERSTSSSLSGDDSDSEFRRSGDQVSLTNNSEVLKKNTFRRHNRRKKEKKKERSTSSSSSSDEDGSDLDYRRAGLKTRGRSVMEDSIFEVFNKEIESKRRSENLRRSNHKRTKKKKKKKKKIKRNRKHRKAVMRSRDSAERNKHSRSTSSEEDDGSNRKEDYDDGLDSIGSVNLGESSEFNFQLRRMNFKALRNQRPVDRRTISTEVTDKNLNYDETPDDYIISTKKNVWDYEHENWANTKKSNLDEVLPSSENNSEKQNANELDKKVYSEKEDNIRKTLLKEVEEEHKKLSIDKHKGFRGPDVDEELRKRDINKNKIKNPWSSRFAKEDRESKLRYNENNSGNAKQKYHLADIDNDYENNRNYASRAPKVRPTIKNIREKNDDIPDKYFKKDSHYQTEPTTERLLDAWMATKNSNYKDDDAKPYDDYSKKNPKKYSDNYPQRYNEDQDEIRTTKRQPTPDDVQIESKELDWEKKRDEDNSYSRIKRPNVQTEDRGNIDKHQNEFKISNENQHSIEEKKMPKLANVVSQAVHWEEEKEVLKSDSKEKEHRSTERFETTKAKKLFKKINMDREEKRNQGRGQGREERYQEEERDQGRGQGRDDDRDQGRGQGRNDDRDQGRGQGIDEDRDRGRDQGRDETREQDRDQGRGQGKDENRGQSREEERDRGRGQGIDTDRDQEKDQDDDGYSTKKKKNVAEVWDRHSNNDWDKVGVDNYVKKTPQAQSVRPMKSLGLRESKWDQSGDNNWDKEDKAPRDSSWGNRDKDEKSDNRDDGFPPKRDGNKWDRHENNEWDSVGKVKTEKTWNKHENNNWEGVGQVEKEKIAQRERKPWNHREGGGGFAHTSIPFKVKQSIFED